MNLRRLKYTDHAITSSGAVDAYRPVLLNGVGKLDDTLLFGGSVVWEDLRMPVTSTKLGGSKDPGFGKILDNGAGSTGVFAYLFDASTEEEVYLAVQMPHEWYEGSDIRAHFHWAATTTDAGNVVWGIEYTWANIDATLPTTTLVTVTDAASTVADRHQMTDAITITGTGKTSSSMIVARVYRAAANGADTYAADAALLEFDIHYQINTLGEATL